MSAALPRSASVFSGWLGTSPKLVKTTNYAIPAYDVMTLLTHGNRYLGVGSATFNVTIGTYMSVIAQTEVN